jgi:hypothetical protein
MGAFESLKIFKSFREGRMKTLEEKKKERE